MKKLLFAYGTLQFPHVQANVVGRYFKKVSEEPVKLDGYAMEQINLGGTMFTCSVEKKEGSIWGNFYEIRNSDIPLLDSFEGYDYERKEVSSNGKKFFIYVKRNV